MILKSLIMQGFKSFPDKIKLDFNDGLTAVVGPNGSGKSNVSDAIKWVMGEQSTKALRGDKMEDVIFGGTANRRPQGFAEVTLVFDNTARAFAVNDDECAVTRKYYRSGESEYLINGGTVRLKDINEMFMDTGLGRDGYATVGQGRITEIVSAKSTARREIFEEASGITKHRYRKEAAQKRLADAEEALVWHRADLTELEDRIGPLKSQSEKAMKYIEMAAKKKTIEVSLWLKTLDKYKISLREMDDKLLIAQDDYAKCQHEIAAIEKTIEDVYKKMQSKDIDIEQIRRQKESAEAGLSDSLTGIAVYETNIDNLNANIQRIDKEEENHRLSAQSIAEKISENEQAIESAEAEIDSLSVKIGRLTEELLRLNAESKVSDDNLAALNSELNQLTLALQKSEMTVISGEESYRETEEAIIRLEESTAKNQSTLEENDKNLRELTKLITEFDEKEQELLNQKKGYELKLNSRREKQKELSAAQDRIILAIKEREQRVRLLQGLEQSMEGFQGSVKAVMKNKAALRGVLGTVAEIVQTDSQYSVAIETALGAAFQHIVTQDEQTAKNAIRFLKEEKSGRATFMPLTSVKPRSLNVRGAEDCVGFVGIAANLVRCRDGYEVIADNLLGNIVVAEDLDSAVEIAKRYEYRFRIVTLDGQSVNVGGTMTGGSQNRNVGILSRKNEIERFKNEIEEFNSKKEESGRRLSEITAETERLAADLTAFDAELKVISEDRIRFGAECKNLQNSIDSLSRYITEAQQERSRLDGKQSASQEITREARQQIAKMTEQSAKTTAEIEKITGDLGETGRERTRLSEEISSQEISLIEKKKDIQNYNNIIEALQNSRRDTGEVISGLREDREKSQSDIKELMDKISLSKSDMEQVKESIENLGSRIESLQTERSVLEMSIGDIRKNERGFSDTKEDISRELVRLDEQKLSLQKEYDTIISKLWEEYQLTRSEAQTTAEEIGDIAAAAKELARLKSAIKALGDVNVNAIEEYKELSARYMFKRAQVEDIERAKKELTSMIDEFTREMTLSFRENFNKINDYFGKIFNQLFGGGKAYLYLTNPEDILESGIDLFVQPPGKIIHNLSALSGGEQALVAISIYFAILRVRPSPFCLLDEIDAALDDVNVTRFINYLRSLCHKTQFIVITHKHGTMESADILYGVTMQEKGVSKILKLHISEIADM
ncbi:MAG: chromosome segregation protein SMC [Oscillospiraceae bacterium]|nr:chromosome segregation protein SMC [Oscillospiraceae bacterium]